MQLRFVVALLLVVMVLLSEGRRYHPQVPPQPPEVHQLSDDNRREGLEIDANTGIVYNPYSKHHPGRHVCTNQKNSSYPLKIKQAYCKPTYKKYVEKCGDQWCAGVKLVYETHHKEVITTRNSNEIAYICCPGWTQITNRSHGCNKPICPQPCLNGGKCVRPNLCSCPKNFSGPQCEKDSFSIAGCAKPCQNGGSCNSQGICTCTQGYSGIFCEKDVDECKEHKPCDQICYNTLGSYSCQCKENFVLQKDGQSCKAEDNDGTSFEAKDLEFETLDKRLLKLETMMDQSHKNEVTKNDIKSIYGNIDNVSSNIKDLRNKLINMEYYRNDMHIFKNKLNQIEQKANKVDDLLLKYEKMKKCAFFNKICI